MRQPVASILLLADAALSDASVPSAVRASLGQIRAEAEWLGDLLQNVLEPYGARAAAGEAQDLIRIASGVVTAAQATYPGDLRLQWREGDMSVAGSAIDLRRAIANLVSNATRAAGPDGTVVIELRRADDQVLLTVDDDGPGFGLIRRGNGIGLQAATQCLKGHGGHIEHSRSRMGGTRATLMLWAQDPDRREG
jgi:signal transduction histidine kinase